jgi:hypothetical protein
VTTGERRIQIDLSMSEDSECVSRSEGPRLPSRHFVPPWLRSPQGAFPGVVALELVLAQTEKVAVGVPRVYGYREGFELELRVVSGADGDELGSRLYHAGRAGWLRPDEQGLLPPEMLRLAVEFADGSRASNVMPMSRDLQTQPAGPTMHAQGGGGGAGDWRQSLWVWPLPPAGPLSFVCEWPALGIPLARHTIDAQLILDAAARAQLIFPHEQLKLPTWPSVTEPRAENQPFVF